MELSEYIPINNIVGTSIKFLQSWGVIFVLLCLVVISITIDEKYRLAINNRHDWKELKIRFEHLRNKVIQNFRIRLEAMSRRFLYPIIAYSPVIPSLQEHGEGSQVLVVITNVRKWRVRLAALVR